MIDMTEHRIAKTVVLLLEYFSGRGDEAFRRKTSKKNDIVDNLEENMENPPSYSTVRRIMKQLQEMGYLERTTALMWKEPEGDQEGKTWRPTERTLKFPSTSEKDENLAEEEW